MSTVGKVLVCLIILPILGWILLASKVAEWNSAWGKQKQTVVKNIETTREQSEQAAVAISGLKKQIDLVLRQKDDAVTGLRVLLSSLFRSEGNLKETIDRYTLQQTSMQQGVEAAQRRVALSTQELADTNKALADERAELARLKELNAKMRDQLFQMRQSLQTTLAENQQMVEKATAAATASPTTSAQPTRISR